MTIKLIALDLDGTLLTSEKTIDPLTKEKLQEAMKMGVHRSFDKRKAAGSYENGSSYCYCDRKG